MSFGSRLKERREMLGITQPQLAEMLGVSKGAVGNYETNVNSPRASILYKVFEVLKCDANYLFQDEMNATGGNPTSLQYGELLHIEKYRDLDDHGKDMVDTVLDKEYDRVHSNSFITDMIKDSPDMFNESFMHEDTADYYAPRAAHERTDIPVTDDLIDHDNKIMEDF